MDQYKQTATQNYNWQQFYTRDTIHDTGIVSPEGYNIHASPQAPYVLTAGQVGGNAVPDTYNPAGMLYQNRNQNRLLFSSSTDKCDGGCVVSVAKPDPRVFQVKPLYSASVFKGSAGNLLPTPYNTVGMY